MVLQRNGFTHIIFPRVIPSLGYICLNFFLVHKQTVLNTVIGFNHCDSTSKNITNFPNFRGKHARKLGGQRRCPSKRKYLGEPIKIARRSKVLLLVGPRYFIAYKLILCIFPN